MQQKLDVERGKQKYISSQTAKRWKFISKSSPMFLEGKKKLFCPFDQKVEKSRQNENNNHG
jgi:hypothetical protein